jgi:hypothetical protein
MLEAIPEGEVNASPINAHDESATRAARTARRAEFGTARLRDEEGALALICQRSKNIAHSLTSSLSNHRRPLRTPC